MTERRKFEADFVGNVIINSLPGVFYFFNGKGRFILWNKNFENVTEYSAEEISNITPLDLFEGEDKKLIADRIQEVFEKGQSTAEADFVSKSGRSTPYFFTGSKVMFDNMPCIVGMGIDLTVRKRAEESLKESEQFLRRLADLNPAVISISDLVTGREIYSSKESLVLLGYKREDIKDMNEFAKSAIYPDDYTKLIAALEELKRASDNNPRQIEVRVKHADGQWRWLQITYVIFKRNADGQPIQAMSFTRDVTETKKAEQRILETERIQSEMKEQMSVEEALRKQAALIDLSPDGIIVKRLDDTITFWSQGAEKLYGWPKEEAVGQKTRELFRTSFPDSLDNIVDQLKRTGKWSGELIHHSKDGHEVIVLSSWLATFDKEGKMIEILETNVDIAERKRSEERLHSASLYARSLIEASLDPLVTINAEGKITDVNQATELATGFSRDQLIGSDFSDYFTEPEEARKGYRQVFTDGFVRDYPLAIRHKSGNVTDVLYNATVYRNEDGEVQGVFAAARDVTERKRAEEKVRAASLYSRSLIEVSLDPLVTISVDGKITDVNKSTEEATGCSRDQLIGSDFSDFFTDPDNARKGYQQVFTEGFVRDYPLAIRHKSGKVTDVLYNASVFRNEAGEIQGIFAAARDITERKRADERLRAASLYARSLIEASLDPLVTISAEGKITDVNKATEEVTGFSREQLIGSDFSHYFTEPDKAGAGYRKVFTDGFVKDYPLAIRHKSGKVTDVLYNATLFKNKTGEIQGVFAAARDVTERNLAENKLRAASLYSRSLIEASLDPLVTISAEGKITDVNKATEDVTGFSRDQLIGSDFSDYFTEPDNARKGYQQVFTEGFVRDYPLAIRHRSGKITDVLYNATVYRNELGEIQGVFAAARDVTEQKEAEMRIREQAELLDQAHDAITVRDLDNRITYWNKGAERLYGWTAAQVMGKEGSEVFYREETPESVEARKAVHELGEWNGQLRQEKKNGKEIIVDSHWTLMRDAMGQSKAILAIATDVTEKKSLESQMLRAQRMESIGTLASGIAHDLNNILTPITLSLQLLQAEAKTEETQRTVEVLEKSARRGAELVRQVLTFARGIEGERKPIQMKHVIAEVERILTETFPKSIDIQTHVSPDLASICGDATQLHQVIMNLCLNARDAMPNGGILKIRAENVIIDEYYARTHLEARVGQYAVVSVSDNGVGIPPEHQMKIFEPFFTTKERGKGTGLGLSTALAIAKSHHGFINFYSEVGKGTAFKMYLPMALGETKETETVKTEYAQGQGELILLVEDELAICEITRTILTSNGYTVLTANDGTEAVALYTGNRDNVKVVLMDMAMPVMDGYMAIRALKKIAPKVKIIAVSGLTENGKLATIASYTSSFLAKPYSSERLLKTIEEVIKTK